MRFAPKKRSAVPDESPLPETAAAKFDDVSLKPVVSVNAGVVGLPVYETLQLLSAAGLNILTS